MKKTFKILTLILAFTFLLITNSAFVLADTSNQPPFPGAKSNAFYAAQKQSILLYNDILNSFNKQLSTSRTDASTDVQKYPDYYGGAYIDDDGSLVVLVTDLVAGRTKMNNILTSLTVSRQPTVTYKLCDISFNKMLEAIAAISNQVALLRDQDIIIHGIGDDILNGRVVVSIENKTAEKENALRAIADYNFLHFEEVDKFSLDAEVGSGWRAVNSGTIGFAATKNGTPGFVVAGHAVNEGETLRYYSVTSSTPVLGTVVETPEYGFNSDAAFVSAASGITPTAELKFGGYIGDAQITLLPVGTQVIKYGHTTQLTTGRITSNSYEYHNIYTFSPYYEATYESAQGDSGGPVLVYDGRYNGNDMYILCGIHTAHTENSYFAPYANIMQDLGITCILHEP